MSYNKVNCGGGSGTTGDITIALSGIVNSDNSSTNNAIVRFNGTDGYRIQNSDVTIDDYGDIVLLNGRLVDGIDVNEADAYNKLQLTIINSDLSSVDSAYQLKDAYLQGQLTVLNNDIISTNANYGLADAYLQGQLTVLNNDIIYLDGYTRAQLTSINSDLSAVDAAYQLKDGYLQGQLTSINSDLSAVDAAYQLKDGYLQGQLTSINSDLSAVDAAYQLKDGYLQGQLTVINSDLSAVDAAYQLKDGYLQGQLTSINSDLSAVDAAYQLKDGYLQVELTSINSDVNSHINNLSNPHQVTAAQLNVLQYADIDGYALKTLLDSYATLSDLSLKANKSLLDSYSLLDHKTRHQSGGLDAIKLDDLAAPDDNTDLNASISNHGLLPKLGGGTANFLRADGSWAVPPGGSGSLDFDDIDGYALKTWVRDGYAPLTHASRHLSGGLDAIKIDDLAAPDDNTDLNASTSKHGLLPKLGGGTTNYLRADGSWAAPAGGISYANIDGYAKMSWVKDGYEPLSGTEVTNWKSTTYLNDWTDKTKKALNRTIAQGGIGPICANYARSGTGYDYAAYVGGVLDETGVVWFVPMGQGNQSVFHKYTISTDIITNYTHGVTVVDSGYAGGCLAKNGRIYMAPHGQADSSSWHYINTMTGAWVAWAHSLGADTPLDNGYYGCCYDTANDRVWLCPRAQSNQTKWHYINASTNAVTAYAHGLGADTPVASGYIGGVLAPNGRFYLVPFAQSNQSKWHYIDTTTGTVVAYAHGLGADTPVANGYVGGVLAQDGTIYLIPYSQATSSKWHKIDSSTNSVTAYTHGATVAGYYTCGALGPDGNIWMAPNTQATQTTWHYINGSTGAVVAYTNGGSGQAAAYIGATTLPNGQVLFIPNEQVASTVFHRIFTGVNDPWNKNLCTSPLFNLL